MKLKIQNLAFLLIVILPMLLSAQVKMAVIQQKVKMSFGEQPAYIVEIPEANYEQVVGDWLKLIRQNTKSKVEESGHEYNIKGTEIKEIYEQPINVYSSIIKADSSVKVIAAFEIDSVFFSFNTSGTVENEKTHHQIQHFMRGFAVEEYKDFITKEFNDAEKVLKTKNKEHKDIAKQIENNQKNIARNEQNIKNSQDLILSYEGENERKLSEVNSKKESISSLAGDSELADEAKAQLKQLEKEKKGIQNKLGKENKNIVKYQAEIEEYKHQIEDLQEKLIEKNAEIEQQEDVVNLIKAKLEGIK